MSVLSPDATEPNALIAYRGAVVLVAAMLVAAMLTLGIGLARTSS